MSLADQLQEQLDNPALPVNEQVRLRVQLSKALEESGNYEGARDIMGESWPRGSERPVLENLDRATAAEVLLHVGVLTSCVGSAEQTAGAQEVAKDLITESITAFEALNESRKVADAQTALALCYWRQGSLDEARVALKDALSRLSDSDEEQKAITLLRYAVVETSTARFNDSLRTLTDAAPLFEKQTDSTLKGRFHNELAFVLRNLGTAERRGDYIDRALVEYAAASYYFEQAGHERYYARVENNLGILFSTIGKFVEAREHADRAWKIFARLKDRGGVAQVGDTRARILLAEGRNLEAERVARGAVHALEKGGEQALLAEALTTHGTALARTGRHVRARLTLQRAVVVGEQAGNVEQAGLAALAFVEELGKYLTPAELNDAYRHAAALLANSHQPGVKHRLLACADTVLCAYASERTQEGQPGTPPEWKGFSLRREMRRHERFLVEQALKEAGGGVTRAAQLLGYKHHYSLISLINQRHKNLLRARSPVVPRKRSLMRGDAVPFQQAADRQQARPVTILHAEDNRAAADAVRKTLEAEGRKVETCADGASALRRIAGEAQYDLLLLADGLPGIGGLELVRLARRLPHRRRTPIIVLSAAESETEAWRAGADAILRKSDDAPAVAETVTRLLDSGGAEQ